MECALRSHAVERAATNRAVGAQPAPLVERVLTSLCGEWWSEPRRPQSLCALADECRAPRHAVATATGEGACFGWSCPRATRARSRQYVLRPPCLWHVLQPQTEVRIARSGCRRRGACHMPLPGGGTTRIKRDQSLSSNPTSRSISIQWAMVHFGGMGSPNIYHYHGACRRHSAVAGTDATDGSPWVGGRALSHPWQLARPQRGLGDDGLAQLDFIPRRSPACARRTLGGEASLDTSTCDRTSCRASRFYR